MYDETKLTGSSHLSDSECRPRRDRGLPQRACKARRADGDYRRRLEVIEELVFVVDTNDFADVISSCSKLCVRTAAASLAR